MKALEKDRGRRYETVNDLAMDVQRYLANEPVTRQPPGELVCRLKKLVRRNRLVFVASIIVVATGILGVDRNFLAVAAG